MRYFSYLAFFIALINLSCSSSQIIPGTNLMPQPLPIPYFKPLSAKVSGGGVVTPKVIKEMKSLGYTTIINLQHPAEDGVREEVEAVKKEGIEYYSIPMGGLDFTINDALAVNQIIAESAGDVLLHCKSGGRVSALWGLCQGLSQNLSPDDAANVARTQGCHEIPESMIQRVWVLLDDHLND